MTFKEKLQVSAIGCGFVIVALFAIAFFMAWLDKDEHNRKQAYYQCLAKSYKDENIREKTMNGIKCSEVLPPKNKNKLF